MNAFSRTFAVDKHKRLIALVIFGDIVYDVLEGIKVKIIELTKKMLEL